MTFERPAADEIFVFGSNLAGVHGGGAALAAARYYGAVMGVGEGLVGQSYALPTMDFDIRRLPLDQIRAHVDVFLAFARERADLRFFLTRIGCGIAGYSDAEIAPMFADVPANCRLPQEWCS